MLGGLQVRGFAWVQLCSLECNRLLRLAWSPRSSTLPPALLPSCDPTTVDTLWQRDATLPEIVGINVQPVPMCKWKLSVMNETSSGGHKAKILGFMVAEENDRMRADLITVART